MAARERTAQLSVLDRLIDENPRMRDDPPRTESDSVRAVKRSLLRDLEWLLNTRQIHHPVPEGLKELENSVFRYGLPDLTSMSGGSDVVRMALVRSLEEELRLFEPRLVGVHVSVAESKEADDRSLRFVVEGLLRMDPEPERVVFDTVLEAGTGQFSIRSD
jgi:type VI secretion system protein ImpF